MRIKFGEWAPDSPDLDAALSECFNAMPYAEHYRPFLGPTSVSDALPGTPIAAISTSEVAGVSETYAATATTLYRLDVASWTDVTGDPGTPDDPMVWDFAQFDRFVLAASYNNILRSVQIDSAGDFAEVTDAPMARVVAAVRDSVMCGDINDPVDGDVPYRVRWSAIADPLNWPLPGSGAAVATQADENDLKSEFGAVRAIFGSDAGLIFQERAITRASYVGAPLVFRFDTMDSSRGLRARKAGVQVGRVVYFLASDGFFATDGSGEAQPIGNGKVDKWFYENALFERIDEMQSIAYPSQKCVAWFFSTSATEYNDHALIYNYMNQRWAHAAIDTTLAFNGRTQSYTLDELDAFGDLDDLEASLDSEFWQGGAGFPAAFSTDFRLGSLDGDPLEATLTTGSFGLDGRRMYVNGVRPLIEGGDALVTLGTQKHMFDAVTWGAERATTPSTGKADFRSSAFFQRAKVRIAAGFTKAIGIDAFVSKDDGER